MPPRNSLREDNQSQDPMEGDEIINVRSQRVARIVGPDGNIQEVLMGSKISRPDVDGSYIDTELVNIQTDNAGNPLPDDPRTVIFSHSGLYITSPEQLASCTSRFHTPNRSRNILVGQDGRHVEGGAVCSHCDAWINTIYMGFGIIGIGLTLGLFRATGIF